MDPDPFRYHFAWIETLTASSESSSLIPAFIILGLLLIILGLISASEVSLLTHSYREHGDEEKENDEHDTYADLLARPKHLLSTMIIVNTLCTIAIIVVGNHILNQLITQLWYTNVGIWLGQKMGIAPIYDATISLFIQAVITVFLLTFVIVIFGKSIPKLYAAHKPRVAFKPTMALLRFFQLILSPFNFILVGIASLIETKSSHSGTKRQHQSIHDIDTAIDLTMTKNSESSAQEADILKGIVKFSDKTTKQIMTPRHDIIGIDKDTNYREVIKLIKEFSYSRLPVYDEDLDKVLGIIYVKDLLEHYDADDSFDWLLKMRPTVLFAPETKKIDELLREFQLKRAHMAIIVDEYGGTTGLVTLEDIMEEIVGEIRDEFDNEENTHYIKIADNSYIFDGKVSLKDVCRIIGVDSTYFDNVRANADSLGGLILTLTGHLPAVDRELKVNGTTIKVITVTKRRIEKISLIKS